MLKTLTLIILSLFSQQTDKYIYKGRWETTSNRRLDGIQTADIKYLGNDKWEGRFYGTWHGSDYDYKVKFTGPSDNLKGTAEIDGANYEWTGKLYEKKFIGKFTGDRYTGSFDMTRQ